MSRSIRSPRLLAAIAKLATLKDPSPLSVAPERATEALEPVHVERKDPSEAPAAVAPVIGAEVQTIRVEKAKLDFLMDQVGEILISRGAFAHLTNRLAEVREAGALTREMREVTQGFSRMARSLQDTVMDLCMQEVRAAFQRYPRVVRDIAQQKGKRIRLELEGEDTKLDKTVIERIGDPLMHLIRNAADHGIEPPEARRQAGKPEEGKIILRAEQQGRGIVISIQDDGRGMDPEILKRKAFEKGLIDQDSMRDMADSRAFELIFLPGFSTAAEVTDISGRGVGMDVVRTNIRQLNGTIDIESRLGHGTRMTIQLPATLAVSEGMLFEAGSETFAMPVDQVVELVKVPWERIRPALKGELLFLRERVLPIARLDRMLGLAESVHEGEANVLVVRGKGQILGVVIDRPLNKQEIVVKPLQEYLHALPGLSGATILGDGRVLLILDADKLVDLAGSVAHA